MHLRQSYAFCIHDSSLTELPFKPSVPSLPQIPSSSRRKASKAWSVESEALRSGRTCDHVRNIKREPSILGSQPFIFQPATGGEILQEYSKPSQKPCQNPSRPHAFVALMLCLPSFERLCRMTPRSKGVATALHCVARNFLRRPRFKHHGG